MADTISVSCNNSCTGACINTCTNLCMNDCNGLCTDTSTKGVFGKDDDTAGNSNPAILGEKAGNCTTCTGTCLSLCGNDCEGGCSQGCSDTCSGDCSETCTLGCTGSCHSSCSNACGDECNSSCKLDCTDSCMGVCEGCTGCSNTCNNECEQQCIFSCVGKATSAENGGMLDFSDATMEEILRTLRWRKISEFPLSPTVLNDDKFIVVDDPVQTEALYKLSVLMSENEQAQSGNILENMDLENTDTLISDYSLKTVRVTAAEFVEYLSTHIKNFVLWYPVYDAEGHTLKWIRTVNENEPPAIDLLQTVADVTVATHENKGLMSAQDKINLDNLVDLRDTGYYATSKSLSDYKIEVNNEFTKTRTDFDTILKDNYVTKAALIDQHYTKGESDVRFLQLTQYNTDMSNLNTTLGEINTDISDINTRIDGVDTDLDKAYNSVSLTNTNTIGIQSVADEKFPESTDSLDHVTVTNTYTFTSRDGTTATIDVPYEYYKYRMATASYSGLLSNTDYAAIQNIPNNLAKVRQDVPGIVRSNVKVSELANDIGYLTASTLPIATNEILGGVKVATDSRISVDTAGFITTKDFSASNMLRNSTFAYGPKYWEVSDERTKIVANDVSGTTFKCGTITMPLNSFIFQEISSTHGKYMTVSFDALGSGSYVIDITSPNASAAINAELTGSTWSHYTYTVDLGDSNLVNEVSIIFKISNSGENAVSETELWIKNIMLQNGMYDTGWVPNSYDGNAVVGFENPFTVDGTTVVENNGVLSSPSEIDDSPLDDSSLFSSTKTFSNQGVKSYIPLYVGNNSLAMTKKLRFTDIYEQSTGYGVIFDKTSTMFFMRATNVDDALSDDIRMKDVTDSEGHVTSVEDIPFRIDLQNNTCHINGSALSSSFSQMADRAICDAYGREIHSSYVTVEEFNAVLEQLKAAIDALNDITTDNSSSESDSENTETT